MNTAEIIICIMVAISIAIGALSLAFCLRKKSGGGIADKAQEEFINETIKKLYLLLLQDIKSETRIVLEAASISNSTMLTAQKNSQDGLRESVQTLVNEQTQNATSLKATLDTALLNLRNTLTNDLREARQETAKQAESLRSTLDLQLKALEKSVADSLDKIRETNEKKLTEMTLSNETKLNEMRGTVEEKLQSTLHERITTSFSAVTTQLAEVQKGLGEMQNLTTNVSSLNRVLNGVKVRGQWGEVSLEGLLEQVLSPAQYGKQVNIKNKNAVDFAVFMPGTENTPLMLPIDAKFPYDDYEKLMQASELGDKDVVNLSRANLYKAVKVQAKSISSKYIDVPNTTNFAIMYLPIEGLYAEVVREPALVHELQTTHNVMLAGPTTLTALLTALQVGFRTLTMQKHSKAIWDTLQDFRKNLDKFVGLLEKSKKNANTIVNDLTDSLSRVEIIDKQLKKIDVFESENKEIAAIQEKGDKDEV